MSVELLLKPNDYNLFLNGTFTGIVNNTTPINQVSLIGNCRGLYSANNIVSVNLIQLSPNIIAYNLVLNQTGDIPIGANGVNSLSFPFQPTLFPSWAIPTATKTINSCVMVVNQGSGNVTYQAFFQVENINSNGFFSLVLDNPPGSLSIGSTFRFIGCSGIYTLT